nr:MAP7 domain-containing protein 1-like [Ipomoea batatas]GMD01442.1 MAP7 domain-containing protein 1-like [Ipomoea batatas]
MIIGASPTVAALQSAQQLRRRTSSSKRASDPVAPTTSKKAKRIPDADPDEEVVTTNANVFRWLDRAQLAHFGLHDTIKALTKDSELLKSSMATHTKEVKGLKAEVAKLNASLTEERESIKKLAEDMKLAREDALEKFKELEAFHEEAITHADLHAKEVVDKWLVAPVGKRFLLDLGEVDYTSRYQDAQKEIYMLLTAKDPTFSPTQCGFPDWMLDLDRLTNPASPEDDQGAKDTDVNASTDTASCEIPIDSAYLNS